MAILFSKYIPINSVVGGSSIIQNRELIGRIITTNPLLPTSTVGEFTSAYDTGVYFGTTSEEYLRVSNAYFNYINSKNLSNPEKISFARWADVDTAPLIFGSKISTTLAQFQAITDGAFILTISGTSNLINGLDFSAAVSLAGVASIIQTEIRTNTGAEWTSAVVAYDNTRGGFNFTGGLTGAATISASLAGSGTEILNLIGWNTLAIFSNGADAQSITDMLTGSTNVSSNFGSFIFEPVLTLDQIIEATTWNNIVPDQNVTYQYYVPVSIANAASYSAALIDFSGTGLVVSEIPGEYPEQGPMCTLATTNYASENAVQNYMYQIYNFLTPSVTDTTTSNTLDSLRVNYYGQTQTNGQQINFFQRGVLTGTSEDPVDMNVYANEQWLRAAFGTALINLLLAVGRIPANLDGENQINATLVEGPISAALINGTISVGKPLTLEKKNFIINITGDSNSWYQVQAIGYWLNTTITTSLTSDNRTEQNAKYTFIYSDDEAVRKIEGTHVLI